jgi:hypothetical protein
LTSCPGKQLHDKLNQILEYLSFTCNQVAYLLAEARNKIKKTIGLRKVQLNGKKENLSSLTQKIEDLEESAINKEIESETYKKWFNKFMGQKALIEGEINHLKENESFNWNVVERYLLFLTNLPNIFSNANI